MIKLAKPNISEAAIKKVGEVLRSGNLIQGEYVQQFEQDLAEYLGVKNVIVVSSGTAALHLSLLALGVGPGDEVIVPAFSFPATANVVEAVGATTVFVDITLDDCCMDISLIQAAITSKTKVIIPVHEFGQSADMNPIMALSKKYNLKIIEDAACALGSAYNGQKVGTIGDFGCYSFHPRKAITTGEGGAVVTNDDEYASKIRSFRNHGIEMLNGKTDFKYSGLNYRMTDFQAVLGIEQLKTLEENIIHRIHIAQKYDDLLSGVQWIRTPKFFNKRRMIYQTYHILLEECINREALWCYLRKNNIEVNIGAQAIHILQYFAEKYHAKAKDHKEAIQAFHYGLAFPIGSHISNEDVLTITRLINHYSD